MSEPPASDEEQPVPEQWRPVLHEIVHAFVAGDFGLADGIAGVEPVSDEDARRIAANIGAYGATLADLTEETWETSVAAWTGSHWDVLVDLRTTEEGASDLGLHASVRQVDGGHRVEVEGVWVE